MNRILREKFVELYSMPILEDVSILNWTFLSSWTVFQELPDITSASISQTALLLYMISCSQLLESFQKSYPALTFPPLPKRGDFNLREVLESPYFFNWGTELMTWNPLDEMICFWSEQTWSFYARMIARTCTPMKHESFISFLHWRFPNSPCSLQFTT